METLVRKNSNVLTYDSEKIENAQQDQRKKQGFQQLKKKRKMARVTKP